MYFVSLFCVSKGQFRSITDEEAEVIFQKYSDIDKQFKDTVCYGIKRALPMLMKASECLNLSAK